MVKASLSPRRHSPSDCACMGSAVPGNPGGREDFPEQHAIAVWACLRGDCGGCIYLGSRKFVAVRTAPPLLQYSDSTTDGPTPGPRAPPTPPCKHSPPNHPHLSPP